MSWGISEIKNSMIRIRNLKISIKIRIQITNNTNNKVEHVEDRMIVYGKLAGGCPRLEITDPDPKSEKSLLRSVSE